jgi:hypothetical protein
MRDCSSMYCKERVLLASRYSNRLCIDLKNDSCVVGEAELGWVGELRELDWTGGLAAVFSEAFPGELADEEAVSLTGVGTVLSF